MKNIVLVAIALFLISVAFLATKSLSDNKNKNTDVSLTKNTPSSNNVNQTFTKEEVAKHNSQDDCWFIIEGSVYDVTNYIKGDFHPGGTQILINYCGGDATNAFNTKDKIRPQPHSSSANQMLKKYYLGELNQ
jgi:cytochrome b involved in lipid metabolism